MEPTSNTNTTTTSGSEKHPQSGQRNILITSALPYVNNVPHLGNIIGSVLSADVYSRYCRNRGYNSIYICGTDEYGTATETKALEEGITPREICDKYFAIHKQIYDWFGIDFDLFGRTSTAQQTMITQDIFLKLRRNGFIFEDEVEQLFCESCQRFLADRFVEGICPRCSFADARGDQCDACGHLINAVELKEPRCKLDGKRPVVKSSKHLFLDLPKLKPLLEEWIPRSSPNWSANALSVASAWMKELKPRCISRDLKWGTPIPLDEYKTDKVFYVWFDACFGYLSITANYTEHWEKWWKAQNDDVELVQFMGKDNTTFHTILFPASLLGTGEKYTLLHRISTTEYLNYESGKFSKSRGTGIFGDTVQRTGIPSDVWRFFLLRNRPETADAVFSWDDFSAKYNGELINTFGNFVNRVLKFCESSFDSRIPGLHLNEEDQTLIVSVNSLIQQYTLALENLKLRDGLSIVLHIAQLGNQYISERQPWVLIKSDRERCGSVIALCATIVKTLATLSEPYMPEIAKTIRKQLGLEKSTTAMLVDELLLDLPEGHVIGSIEPLFLKLDSHILASLKEQFSGKQHSNSLRFIKQREILWPCVLVECNGVKIRRKAKDLDAWKDDLLKSIDINAIENLPHMDAYKSAIEENLDREDQVHSVLQLASYLKSKQQRLPSINTLVDVCNVLSLKHGIIVCAYDRNTISGTLTFALANGLEHFVPINETKQKAISTGEWILKDEKNVAIGKLLTKQSSSTAITVNTIDCILRIQGNPCTPREFLEMVAKEVAEKIIAFCGGSYHIVFQG